MNLFSVVWAEPPRARWVNIAITQPKNQDNKPHNNHETLTKRWPNAGP